MDLSMLNKQQREAVECTEGPLLILAGAGSGKTRVLTHRIAYLIGEKGVSPNSILALTFTNKAAGEMRERVERLVGETASGMWVMTFHSCCARMLRYDIERIGYQKQFTIYDDADQQSLFKRLIRDMKLDDKTFTPRMLAGKISDAKNRSVNAEEYLLQAYEPRQVVDVYRAYTRALKENNALDFDDLLLKTLELFDACPEVLDKYRLRFRYVMVDEYQDTNMAQYRLVSLLSQEHHNLCVVGDDDQSIYGWRGADIRNILEFEKEFQDATVIRLEQNYRSTDAILNAANCIIQNNRSRKAKQLWTDRGAGSPITVYEAADEREEANYVMSRILENQRAHGRSYNDYAILYRTHAQARILEMYLKSYDIPYRVYGGMSFFQRAEVKDILAYMRVMSNPSDSVALLRILNVPRRGLGDSAVEAIRLSAEQRGVSMFTALSDPVDLPNRILPKLKAFSDAIFDVYAGIAFRPLDESVSLLLNRVGYDAYLREDKKEDYEARADIVQEFVGYIREFSRSVDMSTTDPLQAFLENVALFSSTDDMDDTEGRVAMMTLHTAKGLEFPVVFLTGLEEGLFPSAQSRFEPERLEEERRLMYVGITRAQDDLYLTLAKQRMLYGKINDASPSSFLDELSQALPESERIQRKKKPAFVPEHKQRVQIPHNTPAGFDYTRSVSGNGASTVSRVPIVPTPPSGKALDASAGTRVGHKVYGSGTVLSVSGSGNNQIVEIAFDSGVNKKFASAYAPITILEGT